VRGEFAMRIATLRLKLDAYLRVIETVSSYPLAISIACVLLDEYWQRLRPLSVVKLCDYLLAVNVEISHERIYGLSVVFYEVGIEDDVVSGSVIDESLAVAIIYRAARRKYGYFANSIVFGPLLKILMASDLKEVESDAEYDENPQRDDQYSLQPQFEIEGLISKALLTHRISFL
jgi:hypothetical protein